MQLVVNMCNESQLHTNTKMFLKSLDLLTMYSVTFVWQGNGTCRIRHIPFESDKNLICKNPNMQTGYIMNTTISPLGH